MDSILSDIWELFLNNKKWTIEMLIVILGIFASFLLPSITLVYTFLWGRRESERRKNWREQDRKERVSGIIERLKVDMDWNINFLYLLIQNQNSEWKQNPEDKKERLRKGMLESALEQNVNFNNKTTDLIIAIIKSINKINYNLSGGIEEYKRNPYTSVDGEFEEPDEEKIATYEENIELSEKLLEMLPGN